MKRIAAFAAALFLLTTGAWAQDGKGIYNKYSDNEDVSAVYISSSMFKLMGNKVPNMDLGPARRQEELCCELYPAR